MISRTDDVNEARTVSEGVIRRSWGCIAALALVIQASGIEAQTPPLSQTGRWQGPYPLPAPQSQGGYIGTHVAALKGPGDTTRVLLFGKSQKFGVWSFIPSAGLTIPKPEPLGTPPAYLDVNLHEVVHPGIDLFCSGHSSLNGRLVISGGQYRPEVGTETPFEFNPLYKSPTHTNPETGTPVWRVLAGMAEGRWYPTVTSIATATGNKLLATSGTKYGYVFTFGGNTGALQNEIRPLGMGNTVDWTSPAASGTPPIARQDHSAIMDNKPDSYYYKRMVIFGGETGVGEKSNDVYSQALEGDDVTSRWVPLTVIQDNSAGLPVRRSRHTAIYHDPEGAANPIMVVYGGSDESGTALGDVWKLELNPTSNTVAWTRIMSNSDSGPGNRYGHSAIVDPGPNGGSPRMLVFGGRTSAEDLAPAAVWSLDLTAMQWTSITLSGGSPTPREGHGAVADSYKEPGVSRFRMVIFGGRDGSSYLSQTLSLWREFSSNTWSWQEVTGGPVPEARSRHATTRDWFWDRMMIFGGEDLSGRRNDLWTLDLGNVANADLRWSQLAMRNPPTYPAPTPRAGVTAVAHSLAIVERIPELFDPDVVVSPPSAPQGAWARLPNADRRMDTYPFMFVLPSGNLFHANYRIDSRVLQAGSWTWSPTSIPTTYDNAGSAVMYRPGSVLRCGTVGADVHTAISNTDTIRFSGPGDLHSPWDRVSDGFGEELDPRKFHNLTMLPTGDVLVTGGLKTDDPLTATKKPQIWTQGPPARWSNSPPLAAELPVRNYHSAAILLPDGRILSTGGENYALAGVNPDIDKATIFEPPYLFNGNAPATRPVITSAPCRISYGQEFFISTDLSGMVGGTVCLIRPGAVTHGFNQDQIYVPLDMYACASGGRLRVIAPADGGIAPPGDYLLFIVKPKDPNNNDNRIPSIGKWVRVGPSLQPPPDCDVDVPNRVNSPEPIAEIESDFEIWFYWTAPWDNPGAGPPNGTVAEYDVRASTASMTNDALFCQGLPGSAPAPLSAGGDPQYGWVSGLTSCTQYHFALKARDGAENWSPISNPLVWTTLCWGGGGGGGWNAQLVGTLAGAAPAPGDGAGGAVGTAPLLGGETNSGGEPLALVPPAAAVWAVEMGLADDAPVWSIYALGENEARSLFGGDSAGILVQSPEEQGKRLTRVRLYPGAGSTRFALRRLHRPGRLVFRGQYEFRQALAAVATGTAGEVYEVVSARHSRLGDQTALMDLAGNTTSALVPGDTLSLTYQRSRSAADGAQDWFMLIGEAGSVAPVAGNRRALTPEAPTLPAEFALQANQPNPFARLTTLRFALPRGEHVQLEVFDILGRRVRTLAEGPFAAGVHAIQWDARDAHGALLSAGVYVTRIHAGAFRARRTMVLLP